MRNRPVAHFLHVGKTAGTAVGAALMAAGSAGDYKIMVQPHGVRLVDVPAEDSFFFCVRDPLSRYVSGFLSRQRQGRPTHYTPWSARETEAFSQFESPDALGRALGAGGVEQSAAEAAMRSIAHVNRSYWFWFGDEEMLRSRAARLLWIGRQESLDVRPLARALGLGELALPIDGEAAHRAPVGATRLLSPEAEANVRRWYARDYDFLALCDALLNEGIAR
jgi:hypothetical protein